jgi:hypothetical protein
LFGILLQAFAATSAAVVDASQPAAIEKTTIHDGSIPELRWQQRSDWINVKTTVSIGRG